MSINYKIRLLISINIILNIYFIFIYLNVSQTRSSHSQADINQQNTPQLVTSLLIST
jgi:hypothetical protein